PDNIQTGFFIDAPVTGMHYQTSSQLSGQTEKGAFQYRPGDVISFYLGDNSTLLTSVLLMSVSAMSLAQPDNIQTGFFIDAPVTGMHYQTSSQLSGQTEKGAFQYRPGDVISFYLGDN
ncbi:hypothetical protein REH73_23585, partial [Vibrio sinaloensis]